MIDQFLIGSHRNFTYLVSFGGESLVIDPQGDLSPWQERMTELGSNLAGVALTHTHWDHVEGLPAMLREYPELRVYVHRQDAKRLEDVDPTRLVFVGEGDEIPVGPRRLTVLHTPGHSAGECCFFFSGASPVRVWAPGGWLESAAEFHLFTGDTVFVGDVGRTDLESGSTREMYETLQRLKKLAPDTMIYPGHHYGSTPTTTVRRECVESAAFRCSSIEELNAIP